MRGIARPVQASRDVFLIGMPGDTLPPMDPAPLPVAVNRAPVLTLWATVVVERLGYVPETALTLGRFVAGSNAGPGRSAWGSWTKRKWRWLA